MNITKNYHVSLLIMLLALTLTSCRVTTDAQIAAFEKSVSLLEENYKDLTPNELKKALELCEKQYNALADNKQNFTANQKSRLSNAVGHYHRLLLKIDFYSLTNDVFDDESLLEYLKGLLNTDR